MLRMQRKVDARGEIMNHTGLVSIYI